MKNIENELLSFLRYNNQTNYFYYIHKNDGMVLERKEYILDLLLYSLCKSYVVFGATQSNGVFQIIQEVLNLDLLIEESIAILKSHLFMVDIETYNQAIEIVNINISDAYFLTLMENLDTTKKMKEIVSYLLKEMENLRGTTRQRIASY